LIKRGTARCPSFFDVPAVPAVELVETIGTTPAVEPVETIGTPSAIHVILRVVAE